MYGFRRGEVLGLKWSDIDLKGTLAKERGLPHQTPSIIIQNTRVDVDGMAVDEDPKSEDSNRTLPVPDDLVTALKALERRQAEERLAAGATYEDHGLVVVNELGVPPARLQWYSDRFQIMARRAGLPVIRLHDARHTCGTLMHLRGVPAAAISAWLGHASVAFTMRTYVHSQNEALLNAGKTLRDAFGQQAV
ncbi:site-specific integrase [Dactylosporangium sp. CA-139114]|uniref:site-specific integrase n=1 Tax=Dactylosporangium sp. CA-139114 TaxID=3239931 RepID=UPI003D95E887